MPTRKEANAKNKHPANKNVSTKKKKAAAKSGKKLTSSEKAKLDDMNQIEWVPFDPYGD